MDLTDRIKTDEGFCQFPKPDAKGMWVVGYGHDLTEEQAKDYTQGVTREEAEDLLSDDINKAYTDLRSTFPWVVELSDVRQGVLTEMVFQMGIHGLLKFHDLLFHARSGNVDGVAQEMLDSLWHKETANRCEKLARIYLNDTAS